MKKGELKKGANIKDGQVSLSLRGGVRERAGRKPIGNSRKISITLPAEDWAHIDRLVEQGRVGSYSDYFRQLHNSSLKDVFIY